MLTTIFVLLVLGGLGFPIPEEIPLFLGGVAAAEHVAPLLDIFAVCYAGVLIGDQTMYLFGYLFGQKILDFGAKSPFFPSVTEDKINEVREGLRKRRLVYLFIGRHLFLLRSVTFVAAGSLRVPFLEFLAADALAALASVSIFMGIGYVFGQSVDTDVVSHMTRQAHFYITILLVIGVACFFFMKRRKKLIAQKSALVPVIDAMPSDGTEQFKQNGTHPNNSAGRSIEP